MEDVFSRSPHESDAREFDAQGLTFLARKPGGKQISAGFVHEQLVANPGCI